MSTETQRSIFDKLSMSFDLDLSLLEKRLASLATNEYSASNKEVFERVGKQCKRSLKVASEAK